MRAIEISCSPIALICLWRHFNGGRAAMAIKHSLSSWRRHHAEKWRGNMSSPYFSGRRGIFCRLFGRRRVGARWQGEHGVTKISNVRAYFSARPNNCGRPESFCSVCPNHASLPPAIEARRRGLRHNAREWYLLSLIESLTHSEGRPGARARVTRAARVCWQSSLCRAGMSTGK